MVGQSDMPVLNSANPGSRASGWGTEVYWRVNDFLKESPSFRVEVMRGRGEPWLKNYIDEA